MCIPDYVHLLLQYFSWITVINIMFPDELLKRRQVEDSKNFILHKDRGLKLSLINWRIQDQAISVAI